MAHSRIGAGNTVGSLCSNGSLAVVAGDQVFLQGCTGRARDGREFVGQGDPAAQAEGAMQSVRQLLEEAGGRMEDICMVTNYTTQHSSRDQVYPVIARHLYAHPEGLMPNQFSGLIEQCSDFAEITGETGDVVLLHPFVLHAASQNPSGRPRFITNPCISLKEPLDFNRQDPADFSPIEQAVLKGLGVERLDYQITGARKRLIPEREKRQ